MRWVPAHLAGVMEKHELIWFFPRMVFPANNRQYPRTWQLAAWATSAPASILAPTPAPTPPNDPGSTGRLSDLVSILLMRWGTFRQFKMESHLGWVAVFKPPENGVHPRSCRILLCYESKGPRSVAYHHPFHLLRGGASVFDELMLSNIQYNKFTTNTSCGFPQC